MIFEWNMKVLFVLCVALGTFGVLATDSVHNNEWEESEWIDASSTTQIENSGHVDDPTCDFTQARPVGKKWVTVDEFSGTDSGN